MFDYQRRIPIAKPCPLCGSEKIISEKKSHFEKSNKACTYLQCDDCGVEVYGNTELNDDGSYETTYGIALRRVLKKWNRRVTA